MKNPIILKIKEENKAIAEHIKQFRVRRKEAALEDLGPYKYKGSIPSWRLSMEYRHRHIAYCELRGVERSRIEQPSEFNKPNERLITKFKEQWKRDLEEFNKAGAENEEIVCAG